MNPYIPNESQQYIILYQVQEEMKSIKSHLVSSERYNISLNVSYQLNYVKIYVINFFKHYNNTMTLIVLRILLFSTLSLSTIGTLTGRTCQYEKR